MALTPRINVDLSPQFLLRQQINDAVNAAQTGQCELANEKQVKYANRALDDLDVNIQRINELTAQINSFDLVYDLRRLIEQVSSEAQQEIDNAIKERQDIIQKILPILALPLNPLGIIKWVKKLVAGDFIPQLEATIKIIRKLIETIRAYNQLINAVEFAIERIKQLPEQGVYIATAQIQGVVDSTVLTIRDAIRQELDEAVCDALKDLGVSSQDFQSLLNVANDLDSIVRSMGELQGVFQQRLGAGLAQFDQAQQLASQITGVPPGFDCSSPEAFLSSLTDGSGDQFFADMKAYASQVPPTHGPNLLIQGNTTVGSTLTVSNELWDSGNTTPTFSYQWYRANTAIEGANTQTYVPRAPDAGQLLYVTVEAETEAGIGSKTSDTFGPITNPFVSPSNTVPPTITGTSTVGSTLTCTTGVWAGTAPFTYSYKWIYAKTATEIPGANTSTYLLTVDDVFKTIKCLVTATNVSDSVTVESPVFNGPPPP